MVYRVWQARPACCALLCFLMAALACGCSGRLKPPSNAEVSGKITFKGQPVSGGEIRFIAVKGGFAGGANIDENGNYKVSAPVGDVKITVDNRMLQKAGRGAPKEGPHPKNPNAEKPTEMKGHYVALPAKYASADQTDLTYTVKPETQTHDIPLN